MSEKRRITDKDGIQELCPNYTCLDNTGKCITQMSNALGMCDIVFKPSSELKEWFFCPNDIKTLVIK